MNLPLTNSEQNTADDTIDLHQLYRTLVGHWKIIVATALLGLILGLLYVYYASPVYQSNALVQVDKKPKGLSGFGQDLPSLLAQDASPAQTEIELVKSRMVLGEVVSALRLDVLLTDSSNGSWLKKIFGIAPTRARYEQDGVTLSTSDGQAKVLKFEVPEADLEKKFTLVQTEANQFELTAPDKQQYQGRMGELTSIETAHGSVVIQVAELPQKGHETYIVKNSLSEAVKGIHQVLSVAERGKLTGILELSMVGENQKQVSEVLKQIVLSYVNQNIARSTAENTQTISFMDEQIPLLKKKLEESENIFNQFRKQNGTVDIEKEAELILTDNIATQTQINELNLKKAELLARYTNEHPMVMQINAQIATLSERDRAIRKKIAEIPKLQRDFLKYAGDVKINNELYLTMLKSHEQLKVVRSGQIGNVRVVDLPINTYRPIAPKKLQICALTTLLGVILGIAYVLLHGLLRNTVRDPDTLENATGVPVIAAIPMSEICAKKIKEQQTYHLLTEVDSHGIANEGIKSLRTHLMFALPANAGNVILITGERPGVGKSFISANLAVAIAQTQKRVLLIDGDMRMGHMQNFFNLGIKTGLADFLSGEVEDLDVIKQPTKIEGLDFVSRGRNPQNPAELLMSAQMRQLEDVFKHYDFVIIDSPPVLAATDSLILARYAALTLVVSRYGVSTSGQVRYAINQLQKSGTQPHGIVLNGVQQGAADKYSYHYSYEYGRQTNGQ